MSRYRLYLAGETFCDGCSARCTGEPAVLVTPPRRPGEMLMIPVDAQSVGWIVRGGGVSVLCPACAPPATTR